MIQPHPKKQLKSPLGVGARYLFFSWLGMGALQELCYICVLTLAVTKVLPAAQLIVELFFSESAYLFSGY